MIENLSRLLALDAQNRLTGQDVLAAVGRCLERDFHAQQAHEMPASVLNRFALAVEWKSAERAWSTSDSFGERHVLAHATMSKKFGVASRLVRARHAASIMVWEDLLVCYKLMAIK